MEKRVKKLIGPIIWCFVIIFTIIFYLLQPKDIKSISSIIGYAISGTTIVFIAYCKWLWRIIPWNRPPVLEKEYDGHIVSTYKKNPDNPLLKKNISVRIKQTYFSTRIFIETDINKSVSTSSNFEEDNGQTILYYSYKTNPSATVIETNPMQYGAVRMVFNENGNFWSGLYWTSQKTIGDIVWESKDR